MTTGLNRKHKMDWWLALATVALLAMGTTVIYAIGPRVAQFQNAQEGTALPDAFYFRNHTIFVVLSLVMMLVMAKDWRPLCEKLSLRWRRRGVTWKYNFDLLGRGSRLLLLVSGALCLAIPLLGRMGSSLVSCNLGACRSFRLPGLGFGFQAVELFKFAVAIDLARVIAESKKRGLVGTKEFWMPIGAVIAFTLIAICWLQSDLGSSVVILFMVFCMVALSGVSVTALLKMLGILATLALAMVLLSPYRMQRLLGWQGEGDSYHLDNSLIGIGTGGLLGVGIGNSIQSTGYLPESVSDSIFAIICEVFGFAGGVTVMLLFAFILFRMLAVAQKIRPFEQRLATVAVFAWIFAHVIINVLGMTGLIPMKGITLSFLSYGGTSLLFTSAAVGLVLQISTYTEREVIDEDTGSRRGDGRARYSGYRRRA